MKAKFTLVLVLLLGVLFSNAQQVPNSSFDTWTSPLAPDDWSTYESAFGFSLGLSAKDTVDKVVGPASISIKSDSIPGFPSYGVLSGIASLGGVSTAGGAPEFLGAPFTYRPDTLFVLYKYVPAGADTSVIVFGFLKALCY